MGQSLLLKILQRVNTQSGYKNTAQLMTKNLLVAEKFSLLTTRFVTSPGIKDSSQSESFSLESSPSTVKLVSM